MLGPNIYYACSEGQGVRDTVLKTRLAKLKAAQCVDDKCDELDLARLCNLKESTFPYMQQERAKFVPPCFKDYTPYTIYEHDKQYINEYVQNFFSRAGALNVLDDEPALDCSLCQEPLKEDENLSTLGCRHTFHTDCIRDYVKYEQSHNKPELCPLCRVPISRDDIRQILGDTVAAAPQGRPSTQGGFRGSDYDATLVSVRPASNEPRLNPENNRVLTDDQLYYTLSKEKEEQDNALMEQSKKGLEAKFDSFNEYLDSLKRQSRNVNISPAETQALLNDFQQKNNLFADYVSTVSSVLSTWPQLNTQVQEVATRNLSTNQNVVRTINQLVRLLNNPILDELLDEFNRNQTQMVQTALLANTFPTSSPAFKHLAATFSIFLNNIRILVNFCNHKATQYRQFAGAYSQQIVVYYKGLYEVFKAYYREVQQSVRALKFNAPAV